MRKFAYLRRPEAFMRDLLNRLTDTQDAQRALTEWQLHDDELEDWLAGLDVSTSSSTTVGLNLYKRQGGDGTNWSVGGTTQFLPSSGLLQVGASATITTTAGASTTLTVTFPTPYPGPPLVYLSVGATTGTDKQIARVSAISTTDFSISVLNFDGALGGTVTVNWEAIGEHGTPPGVLAAIMADNPILYLPLQESSGTIIDYSGFGHVVTNYNGTTQGSAGPSGNLAVVFNGTNQSIGVPDDSSFSDSTMSWEGWFKPNSTGTQMVISKDATSNEEWYVDIDGGTGKWAGIISNTGGGAYLTVRGGTVDTSSWQHVCMVHDTTTLTLYVNGVQVAQDTAVNGTPAGNTTSDVRIGARPIGGSELFYNGAAAHVAIFPTALTAGQVLTHYNAI